MDCLPQDDVCTMQRDYSAYVQEIVIEDQIQQTTFELGELNGRVFTFSKIDGQYVISVADKGSPASLELF